MEEKELNKQVATIESQVNSIAVIDQSSYEIAGEMVISINDFIKKVSDYWKDPIEKAHQAHKALTAKRGEMLQPLQKYKTLVSQKINQYLTAQEEKRKEEQRKLDEQRKKEEEAERKKLEAKAKKAEEKGNLDKAEELREQAEEVYVPPAIVDSAPKTTRTDAGTGTAIKDIEVEILDNMEVLRHIVHGKLPLSIITISIPKLKQVIKLHQIERLEGVVIKEIIKGKFRGK